MGGTRPAEQRQWTKSAEDDDRAGPVGVSRRPRVTRRVMVLAATGLAGTGAGVAIAKGSVASGAGTGRDTAGATPPRLRRGSRFDAPAPRPPTARGWRLDLADRVRQGELLGGLAERQLDATELERLLLRRGRSGRVGEALDGQPGLGQQLGRSAW